MKDKGLVIGGLILIVLLLVGIGWLYFWQKSLPVKKKTTAVKVVELPLIEDLNRDNKETELYTEISVEDITSGRLLNSEMAKAIPFPEGTIPFKFTRKDIGIDDITFVWDEVTYQNIKANPDLSPYRNLYFYKIAYGDIWLTILGQQVKNKDGGSAFMHYLIGATKDIYSWGTNDFGVTPKLRVHYNFFDQIKVPNSFFRAYGDYYHREGKVEKLMEQWKDSGNVPLDLQKEILIMEWKK